MDHVDPNQLPVHRSGHGCLWGCLGLVVLVVVIFGGLFGYSAWYFYKGFENDPRLATIMDVVRSDAAAEAVLGHNIKVLEIEGRTVHLSNGNDNSASFTLRLAGSKGEGKLNADLDLNGKKLKIVRMTLTGPDGQLHVLVGKEPENPMMQQSI